MNWIAPETDRLLTSGEVAAIFKVSRQTAVRWGHLGLLPCVTTPGGKLRFSEAAVLRLAATRGGEAS